jgi:hypothetical protein
MQGYDHNGLNQQGWLLNNLGNPLLDENGNPIPAAQNTFHYQQSYTAPNTLFARSGPPHNAPYTPGTPNRQYHQGYSYSPPPFRRPQGDGIPFFGAEVGLMGSRGLRIQSERLCNSFKSNSFNTIVDYEETHHPFDFEQELLELSSNEDSETAELRAKASAARKAREPSSHGKGSPAPLSTKGSEGEKLSEAEKGGRGGRKSRKRKAAEHVDGA